jgi:hypothetical protein
MKWELDDRGARAELGQPLPRFLQQAPVAVAAALQELDEHFGLGLAGEAASVLTLPAEAVAALTEGVALKLGLPANTPLSLDVRANGAIGATGCRLQARWLLPGKTLPARGAASVGPWVDWQGERTRMPAAMFESLLAVERFNALTGGEDLVDRQLQAWAEIRQALGEDGAERLTDSYLRGFRVVVPSAFTLSITEDDAGQVQLAPVLLREAEDLGAEQPARLRALTEADEALMVQRLDQQRPGASAFALGGGTYVVVEEPLRVCLEKVRQLRQAPAEERKRAARAPEAIIRELLGTTEAEPLPFVETESYAERVRDIAEWKPPVLPWIKIASQDWAAPVEMGLRIGGKDVPMDAALLGSLLEAMNEAVARHAPTARVDDIELDATPANCRALQALHRTLTRTGADGPAAGADPTAPEVLIIETNFDGEDFDHARVERRPGQAGWPTGVLTRPKPHQETGVRWLQAHWVQGSKGAMLCDDMGLGKSYQALVFARWIREEMLSGRIERRPILMVAPVGLLANWEREAEAHLAGDGLGDVLRAYGPDMRTLKRGSHRLGTAGLDTARLTGADIVFTNYEAVNEYQLSFGAIRFALVILDEAQKIKSPATRVTHAVKALNADFMLAMTGTPVENRLADLWCVADAVQPGALKDLRSFSARFEAEPSNVSALREAIWQEEAECFEAPRLLLRRLKSEKLQGLPSKHEHEIALPMPLRQAEVYERSLTVFQEKGPSATLELIHALRRSSLHPNLVDGGARHGDELVIGDSARMLAMFSVLDQVAARREKALVFLESLDLQEAGQLPHLIQRRYGLSRLPMVINGQVPTAERQARVERFQTEADFDVMLLSPRAGGVGLTLTAANHVIHLSRWWNPAVEDQCSDRVYRIGQAKEVHIYYPMALLPGREDFSFDIQLQQLMARKRDLARQLLIAPAFTHDDYVALWKGTTGQSTK